MIWISITQGEVLEDRDDGDKADGDGGDGIAVAIESRKYGFTELRSTEWKKY